MQNSNAATKALADPSRAPGHLLPSPAWVAVGEGKKKKKSGLIQSHSFPCKVGGWGAAAKDLEGEVFLEVPSWCFTDAKREEQAENSAEEVAVFLERLESPVPPLFPRERLWLLEIGYFIGVAGAEEPKQQCPAKKLFSALSLQAEGIQC